MVVPQTKNEATPTGGVIQEERQEFNQGHTEFEVSVIYLSFSSKK